jgi:hypothetical protein
MRIQILHDSLENWDLWYAHVPYDDGSGGKDRTVVIIDDSRVLVLRVYGAPSQNGQYLIQEWGKANLVKASTVNLTPFELPESAFRRRIGTLHIADRRKIQKILKSNI